MCTLRELAGDSDEKKRGLKTVSPILRHIVLRNAQAINFRLSERMLLVGTCL